MVAGEDVYRIADALSFEPGRTLLIGGWHLARECHANRPRNCAPTTLADVRLDAPYLGDLSTNWIAVDSRLAGNGARVLRATLVEDPRCSIRSAGECQPRLRLQDIVWTGSPGGWRLT